MAFLIAGSIDHKRFVGQHDNKQCDTAVIGRTIFFCEADNESSSIAGSFVRLRVFDLHRYNCSIDQEDLAY
jgi:hypothetical protein